MFPIRDAKPNSSNNKKKESKKPITDTYYNKVSYRESRNIFSSNEPVDPENRLYTDTATHMHQFWTDTIIGTKSSDIAVTNEKPAEGDKLINSEITQNFLKELSKLNKNNNHTPIGCKKCGYVGHFSYECRNNTRFLKKEKNKSNILNDNKIESKKSSETEAEKLLKKKKKKEKKDKSINHKKVKNKRSSSSSRKKDNSLSSEKRVKSRSRSLSKKMRKEIPNNTKKRRHSTSSSEREKKY